MDYIVHGILQTRILEWVAFPFSRGSSQPRDNAGLLNCRQILYQLSLKRSPRILDWVAYISSGYSLPRNRIGVSCMAHGRQILYQLSYQVSPGQGHNQQKAVDLFLCFLL